MTSSSHRCQQSARSHPRLLDHQDLATTLGETGGDTVTMTWLKADVMVNAGISSEVRFFFQR